MLDCIEQVLEGRAEIISASGPKPDRRFLDRRVLIWLLGAAVAALGPAGALSAAGHKHVSSHKSATAKDKKPKHRSKSAKEPTTAKRRGGTQAVEERIPLPRERPSAEEAAATGPAVKSLPPDLDAVKQAVGLVRKGKSSEAIALATSIVDPAAQKLVEWVLLRSENGAGFERYAAFIRANPDWPNVPLLRRRAEARLWQDRRDAATVRRFLDGQPTSAKGRLALARVLMGEGDRAGAEREIRRAWRSSELSDETESAILDEFREMLTRADHTARMDRRIGAKDFGAAMRAAKRAGSNEVAIVKACTAAEANASKAGTLLDAVPGDARRDLGYALCRLHWLLKRDNVVGAANLALAASQEDLQRQDLLRQDTDEWWRERRVLARRLID